MDLTAKKCVPCEGGVPPFSAAEVAAHLAYVKNWVESDNKKIAKDLTFHDFKEAIIFVDKVARLAEDEGHHPDILIKYNHVRLELWTHAVMGLSENDFILAAKIDALT
jgi:4a-hydroxytetrahydrobiopterin dehydratase